MATPLNVVLPAPGWCLIQTDPQLTITPGGLQLPTNSNRRNIIGTVIAMGDAELVQGTDKAWIPDFIGKSKSDGSPYRERLKVGHRVVYRRHAGIGLIDTGAQTDEPEYVFMRFSDLIAMLPEGTIKKDGDDTVGYG